MCAVLQTITKGFAFIGGADLATEIPHGIVIIQGQVTKEVIQFLKAVADLRRVGLVGFCVGLVKLIQGGFEITVTGVKGVGGYVGIEPLCNILHISTPLRQ